MPVRSMLDGTILFPVADHLLEKLEVPWIVFGYDQSIGGHGVISSLLT
jgi:hypothetical protein